jgi:hypothetical protein
MSTKKAAFGLIQLGEVVQNGILNMIEMVFQAYASCLGCDIRSLLGERCLQK